MSLESKPNKKSPKQNSQKELLLQVYMPLAFSILVFLFLAIMVSIVSGPGSVNVHHWANISIVYLSIPLFLIGIISLALLVALIFGMGKLIHWIPVPIKNLNLILLKIALWMWKFSERISAPIINFQSKTYGLKKGLRFYKKKF